MKPANKEQTKKNVAYYLSLPYAIEVQPVSQQDGGGFTACIPLLGRWSAIGDGDTELEAITDLHTALPSLIEEWIKREVEIPEPLTEGEDTAKEYNGKIPLRIPKTLHSDAVLIAKREGVSLNQFVMAAIAEKVGFKKAL